MGKALDVAAAGITLLVSIAVWKPFGRADDLVWMLVCWALRSGDSLVVSSALDEG